MAQETVTIPKEQYDALNAYFTTNTINVFAQIKRMGLKNWKGVEQFMAELPECKIIKK